MINWKGFIFKLKPYETEIIILQLKHISTYLIFIDTFGWGWEEGKTDTPVEPLQEKLEKTTSRAQSHGFSNFVTIHT